MRCKRQHMFAKSPDNKDLEVDPFPYIDVSPNKTFRRMSWGVLLARPQASLTHMWTQVGSKMKADANGIAMIVATTGRACRSGPHTYYSLGPCVQKRALHLLHLGWACTTKSYTLGLACRTKTYTREILGWCAEAGVTPHTYST